MGDTPDILKKILGRKAEEVQGRRRVMSQQDLLARIPESSPPRGFLRSLYRRLDAGQAAVIAELKRASPSKGLLREPFEPANIARRYAASGAACLSVLTDQDFFQGSDAFLVEAREACALPVLRKDFILDAYQVYEARVIGADCILLIVAALDEALLGDLAQLARELGLDVLVEVHDVAELGRALELGSEGMILGINNRDLRTFETHLGTTLGLLKDIPADRLVVTESGIHTPGDVALMREHGVHGFLVGEAFMRAPDPGEKLVALFGQLPVPVSGP